MNAKLEKYLNTVEKHLNPLPASERIDIYRNLCSTGNPLPPASHHHVPARKEPDAGGRRGGKRPLCSGKIHHLGDSGEFLRRRGGGGGCQQHQLHPACESG